MSDRSIPITLAGEDYELRFEPEDVDACETERQMGYIFFFTVENNIPVYLSFRQCRSFIHHGLRTKDSRGDLHYAFPQTPTGAKQAGELIQRAMQDNSGSLFRIWEKAYDAFSLGWFAKPKDGDAQENKEPVSKNSHGTGSKPRNRTHTGSVD